MDENEINCDDVDPEYVPDEPVKENEDIQEQETPSRKRRREFAIWKYFKRVPPLSQKRARCSICLEVKSHRTSSTNLKSHLKFRHPKIMEEYLELSKTTRHNTSAEVDTTETDLEIDNSVPQTKPRWRDPTIWKYFKKVPPDSERIAKCNYCQQLRSYRTSITNLKTHLSLKHPEVVDQQLVPGMKGNQQRRSFARNKRKMWEFLEIETDNEIDAENDTNETGNVKFSSEIWRHFDVEDEEAICALCRETITSSLEHMKNHLEDKHTSVLDDIAQKVLDAASEDDNALEDDEMYTEVVYLEDEPKTVEKSEKTKKRLKVKTERHASTSSDELFQKPKHKNYIETKEPDELGTFINYIAVLLKKVPKESSQKLHLDIINLIMNATQPQNKIVIETVNFSTANANVSAILNDRIVLSQNGTSISDTNTLNTQSVLTVPVQSLIPQHDEINTTSQIVASTSVKDKSDARTNSASISSIPDIRVFSNTDT